MWPFDRPYKAPEFKPLSDVRPEDVRTGYTIVVKSNGDLIPVPVIDCNEAGFSYRVGDRRDGLFVSGSMSYNGHKHSGVLVRAGLRRTNQLLADEEIAAKIAKIAG
jgi:hypothetical protein